MSHRGYPETVGAPLPPVLSAIEFAGQEIASLKQQIASAEQQRDRAREQALNLNEQLEASRDSHVET